MKIYNYKTMRTNKLDQLLKRPAIDTEAIAEIVKPIINDVKRYGDKAVIKYAKRFDGFTGGSIEVARKELLAAEKKLSKEIKDAINTSVKNIERFHIKQKPVNYTVETMPGIKCSRRFVPIENVGLYIPGGSAVLISTMLMLGIPAKIAGCKRIVVSSPIKNSEVHPALAYAALITEVDEFYKVGGAHSIAMMAYGTERVQKVDKIFGPGNQFVTVAKSLVSVDPNGCVIDMLSGPSEVLIIADNSAKPSFIAADLLSQAEHGADSQVILFTTSENLASKVQHEIKKQLQSLPRKDVAKKSLGLSFILIVPSASAAIELSHRYAPEHLILNLADSYKFINKISNAGSVFIGEYSPESAGDYASGVNHSLPTYGYAKSFGGVSVESFMKPITFQKLSKMGLKRIANTVIQLAETEQLQAHANAIKVRLKK